MNDDIANYRNALKKLEAATGIKCVEASTAFGKWMKERSVPDSITDLISSGWPVSEVWWGTIYLIPETDLMRVNDRDDHAWKNGFLIIGGAPNGDQLAVDYQSPTLRIGFLDHERFWAKTPPASIFAPLSESLVDLFKKLGEGDPLPFDYHDAIKARH